MSNGRIIKSSRTVVEGTHKMMGYSDHWDESYDIEYDGEFTPEVCNRIFTAFYASAEHVSQSGSSQGCLRWELADTNVRINKETSELIVSRGQGMCD